jgi:hypothetical protein
MSLFSQSVDLKLPHLFNGIHDQYAYNFVNTAMTGRGHTGISISDRINVATQNPAAFRSTAPHFAFEIMLKGEVYEFTDRYWFNIPSIDEPGKRDDIIRESFRKYQSPNPFSYFGIGFAPIHGFHTGLSYSLNRSIKFNFFRQALYGMGQIDKYPTFNEYQFTFTVNRQIGDLTIGMNNNVLLQRFDQYRNDGRFDIVAFDEYIYRPQIGLLYELDMVQAGISFTPKTTKTIGFDHVQHDAVYQTNIKTGLSANAFGGMRLSFDTDINLYSETSEHLSDRIVYKFGVEKLFSYYSFKAGFIHSPSMFSGLYNIPNFSIPGTNHDSFYDDIPFQGNFRKTDMNIITVGTSVKIFPNVTLNMAFLSDVGDVQMTSVMSSLNIDFSVFDRDRR